MTTLADAPANLPPVQDKAPVKDRVAAFETIFWSRPPFLSGVYPIDKSGYRLYYGGEHNPRYALHCLTSSFFG